jgi:hypothetical protein
MGVGGSAGRLGSEGGTSERPESLISSMIPMILVIVYIILGVIID